MHYFINTAASTANDSTKSGSMAFLPSIFRLRPEYDATLGTKTAKQQISIHLCLSIAGYRENPQAGVVEVLHTARMWS